MKTEDIPESASRGAGAQRQILTVVGVLVLLCYYAVFAYQNRGMQLDDALIYQRYIENLVAGHGLVYNVGIRFNGLTSPLFSYCMAVGALIFRNASLVSVVLSAVFTFASAVTLWKVFADAVEAEKLRVAPFYSWLGALLFLAIPYFYVTYGMETGLYTLLSALLIYHAQRENYRVAGPLAALLFLTRSEGVFLVAAIGILHLARHRSLPRFDWRVYLLPPLLILASFAFNFIYYGHATAETGMAKVWQGQSGLWGDHLNFLRVEYLYAWIFQGNFLILGSLVASAILGVIALGRSYLNLVIALYLTLYSAFYILLNIPNYHWYYSPYFALLPYYAAVGVGFAVSRLAAGLGVARSLLIVLICVLPIGYDLAKFSQVNAVPRGGHPDYQALGKYIASATPEDSVVAAVEIGTLGYYANRQIVDILGLVNPDNARYIGERNFDEWLKHYQVDYLVAHKPAWDHEVSLYSLASGARLVEVCDAARPGLGLYHVERGASAGIQSCDGMNWEAGDVSRSGAASYDASAGYVDSARVTGNFLRLQGWAQRDGQVVSQMGFPHATSMLWRRMERADVAAHFGKDELKASGYEAVIGFNSHEAALHAMQGGCLQLLAGGDAGVKGISLDQQARCAR